MHQGVNKVCVSPAYSFQGLFNYSVSDSLWQLSQLKAHAAEAVVWGVLCH